MINFMVSVVCAAHVANCPMPQGFHQVMQSHSVFECVRDAKAVVSAMGGKHSDYLVTCEPVK